MGTYYELLLGEDARSARRRWRQSGRWRGASWSVPRRASAAEEAERHFDRLHKEHLPPEEIEEVELSARPTAGRRGPPAGRCSRSTSALSRSEARRLLGQGGVRLNGEALGAGDLDVDAGRLEGGVLQVGRREFRRVRVTG